MIRVHNICGMNGKKIKVMKRSSGHARTEIRRRYAIAWVEYIDLSRPRPPRSHRHRRCYCHLTSPWISPHFEPRIRLCLRLWKTLVSRPCELYFNFDSPLSASRSCDIRAEHYCPWYWRCRPCYTQTSRMIHEGYIHIHACDLSMILCRMMNLCTGISSYLSLKDIGKCYTHVSQARWCKIANPYRAFYISCSFNILRLLYLLLYFNI